jgi:hypothetical protein
MFGYKEDMVQKVRIPVSVNLFFDHRRRAVRPVEVVFDGKAYSVLQVGLHHTYREGRTLFHVFSVASDAMFFRLVLNTDNLFWTLEEISDGEAN